MTLDILGRLAALIEKDLGALCGECGDPHATNASDYTDPKRDGGLCVCECCWPLFAESLARQYPELVVHRGGATVVTESMVDEIIRRLEAEIRAYDGRDARMRGDQLSV